MRVPFAPRLPSPHPISGCKCCSKWLILKRQDFSDIFVTAPFWALRFTVEPNTGLGLRYTR